MVSEEVAAAWRERARRAGINIAFSMAAALLGGPPSAGGQAVAASADESSTAERTEFALGGGFHVSPDITDVIQLPAVPTVNVRVTRWLNDRWGVTGNVIAGVGSGGRELDRGVHDQRAARAERAGVSEPVYFNNPTHIQFLIRYRLRMRRLSGKEAGRLYFGIGASAVGVSERNRNPAGLAPDDNASQFPGVSNYRWSPAVVVVELLRFPGNRPAVVLGARRARAASARGGAGVVPSAAGAPQPARRRGDRPGGDVGLAGGESSGALGGPLVQSLAAATVILLLVFAVRERLLMRLDAWIYPETADHWIRTRRP